MSLFGWLKGKSKSAKEETREGRARPVVSEKLFPPAKDFYIGRRLAFQIEDRTITLAVASMTGTSSKLLAIEKASIEHFDNADDRSRAIARTIQRLVTEYGSRRAEISLVYGGKDATYRTFAMPAMGDKELQSAIKFELPKQVPFPLDECFYAYSRQSRVSTNDNERDIIGLQAATRSSIQAILAPFDAMSAPVAKVLFTPLTIAPLLHEFEETDANTGLAVLGLYRDRSEIAFYRGSMLEFHRSGTTGTSLLEGGDDETRLEYFAETLATEVQTSFDFYSGQFGKVLSNKVLVFGDVSSLERLTQLLTRQSSFEFEPFPVDRLHRKHGFSRTDQALLRSSLPVAAAATQQSKLPDLLPEPRKEELQQARLVRRTRSVMAAALIVLAAGWWYMTSIGASMTTEMEHLEGQLDEIKRTDAYTTYQVIRRQIALSQQYVDQAKETPSHFNANLRELSRLTPSNVYLITMDFNPTDGTGMTLDGTVVSGNIPPEITLAEYVENLTASPFYRDVKIKRHVKRRLKDGFEIDFTIAMAGGI